MTKKTRLIPFDYERYKAAQKCVTRDGREVIEVHLFEKRDKWPLLALIKEDDECQTILGYSLEGKAAAYNPKQFKRHDLFLEQKLEEKTFYVNVWPPEDNVSFSTLEAALSQRQNRHLGTLKITYTEEDLIR